MSFYSIRTEGPLAYKYYGNFHGIRSDRQGWAKRTALVALPFLALCKPIGNVLTFGSGLVRTYTSFSSFREASADSKRKEQTYHLIQTTMAAATVFGIVMSHPIGRLMTTAHDLIIELTNLRGHLTTHKESKEVIHSCLKIFNHVLYLALLTRGGVELAAASMILQVLTELICSIEEFLNGYKLEGFAHLIMYTIRYHQAASLLESVHVKWFVKDDLETWKETLSPTEKTIKRMYGTKYLYFKKNDQREKCLILYTAYSHNDAFKPDTYDEFFEPNPFTYNLKNLENRFDIKFRVVSNVEDIRKEIAVGSQVGRITSLILGAHGHSWGMLFGPDPTTSWLTKETIPLAGFSKLDPNCVICLESCSTAEIPDQSIAYDIAHHSNLVTFASRNENVAIWLDSLNPLTWIFDSVNPDTGKLDFSSGIKIEPSK